MVNYNINKYYADTYDDCIVYCIYSDSYLLQSTYIFRNIKGLLYTPARIQLSGGPGNGEIPNE